MIAAALLVCGTAGVAAAGDLDPDREIARRRFEAGSAHYAASEYALALRELEMARLAKPHPAI